MSKITEDRLREVLDAFELSVRYHEGNEANGFTLDAPMLKKDLEERRESMIKEIMQPESRPDPVPKKFIGPCSC